MDLSETIDRSDYLEEKGKDKTKAWRSAFWAGSPKIQIPVSTAGFFVDGLRRSQRL